MANVEDSFVAGARKDLNAWDCDAMYPKPQKVDLGAGKWLGAITKYAKQGFAIYNQVKKFIPGGSKAGAGKVPGSHEEEELVELAGKGMDWGQAKEIATGLGKKLLDKIQANVDSNNDNYGERLAIW